MKLTEKLQNEIILTGEVTKIYEAKKVVTKRGGESIQQNFWLRYSSGSHCFEVYLRLWNRYINFLKVGDIIEVFLHVESVESKKTTGVFYTNLTAYRATILNQTTKNHANQLQKSY